ncbi:MAG: hypothetical protein PHS61_04665 [Candidatus Omnitrophica bacterium]|nr:hypothetical protein [Candidatus Omnitrophota bacterium]
MGDEAAYEAYLRKASQDYEGLCRLCGGCCGLFEKDPCRELARGADGRYYCRIYEDRFGLRRTIHGNEFLCAPVRKVLSGSWAGSYRCAYKNYKRVY